MNFEQFYHEHSGKRVKVTMTDGEVLEGEVYGYISELDNDPDPESIIIKKTEPYLIELPTNEIKSIELVNP